MIRTPLFLLIGCFSVVPRASAIPAATYMSGQQYSAERWQPIDLVFTAEPGEGNPFDVEFSATFTGVGGGLRRIPGFFDGENRWVIRFAPPVSGAWSFVTSSSLPALRELSGKIKAAESKGRHGPIGVDPSNATRFAYADGTIYFPIAFEADWLFALDAENPAGIPNTEKLLRHLATNGFNQVILNVFAYDVQWPRDPSLDACYDYGKPRVFPFGGDNTAPDHGTLNPAFFQHLDRVIEHLDRIGVAAHLMIYVWNKQVAWPESGSDADNRYFDYVIKRYQAFPNLIWDISKEATGYGHNDMAYITDRISRLRSLDGHFRLVTVHDYGYCDKFPGEVDFISIQNWGTELWNVMMDVREKHPDKPLLNIEHGGYERGPFHVFDGSYLSPEVCLERAYLSVFAGAYPTHYWQDAAWNVIIPDPSSLPPQVRPRFEYYRHLATLAERYDLATLTPDRRRSSSGFCMSNQRDLFVYLVPKENTSIVVRPPMSEKGKLHASWFDPFTGETSTEVVRDAEPFVFFNHPSTGQFAVLVVRLESTP